MSIKIPYLRKSISSTLIALSAVIALLLISPLLPLSNLVLLQPAQAQTAMNFRTPTPASGTASGPPDINATLIFDVHGTRLVSPERLDTNGAYQITSKQNGKILSSEPITQVDGCCLNNDSSTGKPILLSHYTPAVRILISTSCSTSATNHIDVMNLVSEKDVGHFQGPVECSPQGGNTTTNQQQQSSSSMTGSSQDGDRDGIPDSSDRCASNSNQRCYKESK